jgi:hypothetical protein
MRTSVEIVRRNNNSKIWEQTAETVVWETKMSSLSTGGKRNSVGRREQ